MTVTKELQQAIVDFVLRRVDKAALDRAIGFDIDASPAAVFALIEDAQRRMDADSLECALLIFDGRTGDIDVVPTLTALLRADWHRRHEDIALRLQQLRDARASDALFETTHVRHPYLEHSPGVLARKCTWALADIGTPEAYERLRELAAGGDAAVAGYAQKRLDGWSEELSRKGPPARSKR